MGEGSNLLVSIGARLAICRNELGFSQAAMAQALGLSHRAYHSYERGTRSMPLEPLVKMHTEFDVDLNWILLGSKAARVEHDLAALRDFEVRFDNLLVERNLRLSAETRGAIVERWYRSYVEGQEVSIDQLRTWIDLMAE